MTGQNNNNNKTEYNLKNQRLFASIPKPQPLKCKKAARFDTQFSNNMDKFDPCNPADCTPEFYRLPSDHFLTTGFCLDNNYNICNMAELNNNTASAIITSISTPPSSKIAKLMENDFALRAALQSPQKFRNSMPAQASYPIIWDLGASISITFQRNDFSLPIVALSLRVKGIANKMKVAGEGTVLWTFQDDAGMMRLLKVHALYVPKTSVRLLSTTDLLKVYKDEKIISKEHKLTLTGIEGDPSRQSITVKINLTNNLPVSYGYDHGHLATASQALHSVINEVTEVNSNLTESAKELLRWHYCPGHLNICKVQLLFHSGVLANTDATRRLHTAASRLTFTPLCAACQYRKQK
ncbi:hypothetical protein ACA910_001125 [Epithemia clementina (nom. ined.)]